MMIEDDEGGTNRSENGGDAASLLDEERISQLLGPRPCHMCEQEMNEGRAWNVTFEHDEPLRKRLLRLWLAANQGTTLSSATLIVLDSPDGDHARSLVVVPLITLADFVREPEESALPDELADI